MTAYTGTERRVLDPRHPAVVEPLRSHPRSWRVRTGKVHIIVTEWGRSEDMAYLHNYMHGHLIPRVVAELKSPDRRASTDPDAPVQLDPNADDTDPALAGEAGDVDALLDASRDSMLRAAVDHLDRASSIENVRGEHRRAALLYEAARTAEGVLGG